MGSRQPGALTLCMHHAPGNASHMSNESASVTTAAPAAVAPALTFASLALSEPIQRAIADKGYTTPSPIQAQAIPYLLQGRDLIGLAQTGTGKTAAFALPILNRLAAITKPRATKRPRALILTPTRELAIQIGENIAQYGSHLHVRTTLVFGGVGEHPQIKSIAVGTDILVATPGRLMDLMGQKHVFLDQVEVFVLDEADRMLDMGFAPDVKRITAQLPDGSRRQSLLFSATMPDTIRNLANSLLRNPALVEIVPNGTTVERIEQKVCFVDRGLKQRLLTHFLKQNPGALTLVFSRTKHGADRIAKNLKRDGIDADAIHGNKGQGARQRALENFRNGNIPVLVATDIAARGIDVKDVALVINYDLPEEPEAYVHRIGRTARAGASGQAIAFCDHEERDLLRDIQRLTRRTIPVDKTHPYAEGGEIAEKHRVDQVQRRREQPQQQQHAPGRQHHGRGEAQSRGGRGGQQQQGRPHHGGQGRPSYGHGPGERATRGPVAQRDTTPSPQQEQRARDIAEGGAKPGGEAKAPRWAFWRR